MMLHIVLSFQEVITEILNAQKLTPEGEIKLPSFSESIVLPRKVSYIQLRNIRIINLLGQHVLHKTPKYLLYK